MNIADLTSIAGYVVEDDARLFTDLERRAEEFPADRDPFEHCIAMLALLDERHRFDLARPWAEQAFRLQPDHPTAQEAIALCADLAGDFRTAAELRRRLLDVLPGNPALITGILDALDGAGKYDEAFAFFASIETPPLENPSVGDAPDILRRTARYGEMLLRRGDAHGFMYFLAHQQFRIPAYAPTLAPAELREAAPATLEFSSAGGFGDQFLFASLLPRLAQSGMRIRFSPHPDLREIFAASFAGIDGIELGNVPAPSALAQPWPRADASAPPHVSLFQAPLLAAATPKAGGAYFQPYLRTPDAARADFAEDAARIRAVAQGRRIIGITWDRAQRYFPNIVGADEACRTARTSCPYPAIAELFDAPELQEQFHFVALHESDAMRAWPETLPANLSIAGLRAGDFRRTLAAIELCEAVVSVDMSVANVAAMAGKPVHVMLLPEGDWRWGYAGVTPWMNGVQRHYAPTPGEWPGAVASVRTALRMSEAAG